MILKIVSLFLIVIAVLGMFGGMRWKWLLLPKRRAAGQLKRPGKCPSCGAFRVGKGPCACGKDA